MKICNEKRTSIYEFIFQHISMHIKCYKENRNLCDSKRQMKQNADYSDICKRNLKIKRNDVGSYIQVLTT